MRRLLASAVIALLITSALVSCTPDEGTDGTTTTAAAVTTTLRATESGTEAELTTESDVEGTDGTDEPTMSLPETTDDATETDEVAESSTDPGDTEYTEDPEETEPAQSTQSNVGINARGFYENRLMFDVTKLADGGAEFLIPYAFAGEEREAELEDGTRFGEVREYTVNDDGSISIMLNEAEHQAVLGEAVAELEKAFANIKEDSLIYLDLEYNEDVTEFTFVVDPEGMLGFEEVYFRSLMVYSDEYQVLNGVDPGETEYTIEVVDEGGTVLSTYEK